MLEEKFAASNDGNVVAASANGSVAGSSIGSDVGSSAKPLSLANRETWNALRSPSRLQLFEAIRSCPGVDARALAQTLGANAPKLYYHLNVLIKGGLVVAETRNERTLSRGPEARAYRAVFAEFPAGFFDGNELAIKRCKMLLDALSSAGIQAAIESAPLNGAGAPMFRLEVLDKADVAAIHASMQEIARIVESARNRRVGRDAPICATHFVSCCLAATNSPTLPDMPLNGHSVPVNGQVSQQIVGENSNC